MVSYTTDIIILAGGFGTRLPEYTDTIPKPMVEIGNHPILMHIINIYSKYDYNSFLIALGYKAQIIIDYFDTNKNFKKINNSRIDEYSGVLGKKNIQLKLIETGVDTMTGGRIRNYINSDRVMVTYGDGLADINIAELESFHQQHGSIGSITAVRPPARFGSLKIEGEKVIEFREKSILDESWINGGFFIFEKSFLNYLDNDKTFLEREPLENLSKEGQLHAYKHQGFWQCMDTKRDRDSLQELFNKKEVDVFIK